MTDLRDMTTGEAEAYRRGFEEAKRQAAERARQVPMPDEASAEEAHGRISAALEAAMRILAMQPEPSK